MENLLQCQKRMLLTRTYDEKTDTLMYECRHSDGKRRIVAVACENLTTKDVECNIDFGVLNSFKSQCCMNCKECKEAYHS